MRILLRNLETKQFFKSATAWTKDTKEALSFNDSEAAVRKALDLRLQNIELVCLLDDGTETLASRLRIDP